MFNKTNLAAVISASVMILPVVVSAEVFELEEILVTAQKRTQSVQDVPMAVSAFDGNALRAMGAVDTSSIVARTPGLGGGKDTDTQSVLTMRGVGTGAFAPGTDNSVGTYFNEVPMSRAIGGAGFLDIERVEVVKGPQGTLFGRNTSSGAISVTNNSADLDENSLDLRAALGNESQEEYEVVANKAISDSLAFRFAGKHDEHDGTYRNQDGTEFHGRDHDQWRLSAHWQPSNAVDVKWFWEEFEMNSFWAPVDDTVVFEDTVAVDTPSEQKVDNQFSVLNVTWDINDDYTLTSNTGYLDSDNILSADGDFAVGLFGDTQATAVLTENWTIEQFTQDFRINASTYAFDWFVGASYFNEKVRLEADLNHNLFSGGSTLDPDFGIATNETDSYAVYGDVSWKATDKLTVTLGARYTVDEKYATVDNSQGSILNAPTAGEISSSDEWESFDPRLAVDYALTDEVMVYFNYAQGFKAGGFNKQPDASGLLVKPVDPEENDAYEIGVKADFWENRARVNAAVFFYDYSDFQTETQNNGAVNIFNVGAMESSGLEIDATLLVTRNLDLRVAYAYLDTEFTKGTLEDGSVDLKGNKALRAPESSYSAAATYSFNLAAGEVSARLEYTYTDEMFYDVANTDGLWTDDYALLNASVSFNSADDSWGVSLIGENLGDEEYIAAKTALFGPAAIPGMSRLIRVVGRYSF